MVRDSHQDVPRLQVESRLSRRQFVQRLAVTGIGISSLGMLLSACGSDSNESDGGQPAASAASSGSSSQGSSGGSSSTAASTSGSPAAASTSTTAASGSGTMEELVIGWSEDVLSMDPSQMRATLGTELGYKVYSNLVRVKTGTAGELVPDLATKWEISPDGLEQTFTLQPDAKWHRDFGAVTADDVKYTLLRHHDKEVASLFATEASTIKDVEVVDAHTAKVIMSDPYPGFLVEFAAYRPGFIVNQKAIEQGGDRYTEQPIGSGPFVFEKWSPKEKVELSRSDAYYAETGPFKKLTYNIISEEATMEIALDNGDIDLCYLLSPETQNRALSNSKLTAKKAAGPRTYYLQLNEEHKPFDDVRVRQALWYAIDKNAIVAGVMKGQGFPTETILNTYCFGRVDTEFYTYDPDKAKQLLADAGLKDGFKTSILIYDTDLIPDMGAAIQAMWKKIGVEAELIMREWAQHVELRRSGNFDVGLQPQLRLGPDQYLTPLVNSKSAPYPNASRYKNPQADELIEKARVTVDDKERADLYAQIQQLVADEVPIIPLVNPVFVIASKPTIQGAVPGLVTVNVTELTVAGS